MVRPMQHKIACWVHAILRYADPHVRLMFPDDGPNRPFVFEFARGAGSVEEILEPVPPAQRLDALAAADIALLLPRGLGAAFVLAEVLAAGLPTVAFAADDLAQQAGQAVCFAKARTPRAAAQAVLRLLESPEQRHTLTAEARRHADRHFGPDAARSALHDVYAKARRATPVEGGAQAQL